MVFSELNKKTIEFFLVKYNLGFYVVFNILIYLIIFYNIPKFETFIALSLWSTFSVLYFWVYLLQVPMFLITIVTLFVYKVLDLNVNFSFFLVNLVLIVLTFVFLIKVRGYKKHWKKVNIFEFTYLNCAIFYYKNPFQYFESGVDQTQWFTLLLCIFFLFNKTSYFIFLSLEELTIFLFFGLFLCFTLFGLFLLKILYNFF
jgi:hypothetical protein